MSRTRPRIPIGTLTSATLTTSYVQLSASLGQDVNHIEVTDTSNCVGPISLAYGPSGSEVELLQFMPGCDKGFGALLNKGMRISIKSLSGAATSGLSLLRLFQ